VLFTSRGNDLNSVSACWNVSTVTSAFWSLRVSSIVDWPAESISKAAVIEIATSSITPTILEIPRSSFVYLAPIFYPTVATYLLSYNDQKPSGNIDSYHSEIDFTQYFPMTLFRSPTNLTPRSYRSYPLRGSVRLNRDSTAGIVSACTNHRDSPLCLHRDSDQNSQNVSVLRFPMSEYRIKGKRIRVANLLVSKGLGLPGLSEREAFAMFGESTPERT